MFDCTLSKTVTEPETHAEDEHLLVRYASKENAPTWDELTDPLIEWPLRCDEDNDGLGWPSRSVLASAYSLACKMRNLGEPVPSNIVPNGDGGVVFEWRGGPTYIKVEIDKDGSGECLGFTHGTLVFRELLSLA